MLTLGGFAAAGRGTFTASQRPYWRGTTPPWPRRLPAAQWTALHAAAYHAANDVITQSANGCDLTWAVVGDAASLTPNQMCTVPGSVGDFFWGGALGTYFWVDPRERLVAILMMQEPAALKRARYRSIFRNLVYQALRD